jgi:hypothetical protein
VENLFERDRELDDIEAVLASGGVLAIEGGAGIGKTCLLEEAQRRVPGRSPRSGDYKGHEEVIGFFTKGMERSAGSLRVVADEIIADGERVVLATVSAERHGHAWSSPEVHVVDGKRSRSTNSKATSKPRTSSGRRSGGMQGLLTDFARLPAPTRGPRARARSDCARPRGM